ncbi:hypothetical protein TorRG33x02_348250 [Trema orientale]|uniref:Secreted protein n=1 Tax=Trema orientale TaxID=63057 RepID=A0A2P5AKA5_TREOI|nr:hypothetical protein TorRG33x02_348250 [Trema orientale]
MSDRTVLLLILAALLVGSRIGSKMESLLLMEWNTLCLSTNLQTVSMVGTRGLISRYGRLLNMKRVRTHTSLSSMAVMMARKVTREMFPLLQLIHLRQAQH